MEWWKKGLIVIGGLVGTAGIVHSIARISTDVADGAEYTMECVKARETFDVETILNLTACENNSEVQMDVKGGWSENKYTMFAESNYEEKQEYVPVGDTALEESFTVKRIEMDGVTYTRGEGPKELFDKADEKWREYWRKAECDEMLNGWEAWKVEKREQQQYGDTVKDLVDRL